MSETIVKCVCQHCQRVTVVQQETVRQLLSEADKREAEARAKALEEAAKVAWIEGWKSPDEISAAIRALQSEER